MLLKFSDCYQIPKHSAIYVLFKNSNDIFQFFLQESTSGSGSLFIDRLNEETIKKVSDKLEGGERDLFAPCVKDVKALLSKEPFQEFLK